MCPISVGGGGVHARNVPNTPTPQVIEVSMLHILFNIFSNNWFL